MIVARSRQTTKVKTSPIGTGPKGPTYLPAIYEIGKQVADIYGYYENIKPYLPETYIDKYTYKPRKRIAGYLGQKLYEKKKFRTSSSSQLYQKRFHKRDWCNSSQSLDNICQSSY